MITSESSDSDVVRDYLSKHPKSKDSLRIAKKLIIKYPNRFQDIKEAKSCVEIILKHR